jgi:PAS domain S-box-containing protein
MFLSYTHFFAFILYSYLAIFVWSNNRKVFINRIFFFLMLSFAVWSLGKVWLHNPHAPEKAIMIMQYFSYTGGFYFPLFIFWVALLFSHDYKTGTNPWLMSVLFVIPAGFLLIQVIYPFITIEKTWFGNMMVFNPAPITLLFAVYYIGVTMVSLLIIFRYIIRQTDIREKWYGGVYIMTTLVCLAAGTMTDTVLPAMGFRVIPDVGNIISILWAVGIAITILKYRFFIISPSSAAYDILRTMTDAVLLLDAGGHIQTVNHTVITMLNYSEEELIGKHIKLLFPRLEIDKLMINVLLTHKPLSDVETSLISREQEQIPVLVSTSLMKSTRGMLMGIVCVAHDITNRKRILEALRDSRQSFLNVVEKSNEGIIVVSEKGDIRYINPVATNWFHLQINDHINSILQFPFKNLEPDEVVLRGKTDKKGYGEVRYVETNWDRSSAYLLNVRDITRRREDEEKIHQALKDKEVLLSEIHHRVKNNLQVILSLLRLQLSYENNDSVCNMLLDMQNRVSSMSIIHEMLYATHELSSINLRDYVQRIVDILVNVYSTEECVVEVDLQLDDLEIDVHKAIPSGLIINELVSNAMKYAFNGRKTGTIVIGCSVETDYDHVLDKTSRTMTLFVADDGVGLPEGFNPDNSPSLGLRLVKLLCRNQLDGECSVDRASGTKFTIEFSIDEE